MAAEGMEEDLGKHSIDVERTCVCCLRIYDMLVFVCVLHRLLLAYLAFLVVGTTSNGSD